MTYDRHLDNLCMWDSCGRPMMIRGVCGKHYRRMRWYVKEGQHEWEYFEESGQALPAGHQRMRRMKEALNVNMIKEREREREREQNERKPLIDENGRPFRYGYVDGEFKRVYL